MLRYRVLCVGRRARDPLLDAADDYLERLGRYAKVELVRLRDSDPKGERDALLNKLRPDERVVALDERGTQLSSVELSQRVRSWEQGSSKVALLIGGADGLHDEVRQRAHESLALSKMTLPHRLALALLCEQLYRAHTIVRGERYHRS